VFCAILASGKPDSETHIVWRHPGGAAFAILNAFPYCSGHLMVMPTRHVGELEVLTPEESRAVWDGVSQAVRALKSAYRPDGLNLGANLGRAGGAGVPGHFHMHVLPRWGGDTNFMTTVANTRVLPEALPASAAKLRAAWPSGDHPEG
jgi:diadenosine tetraphosphate (Ap4A) HIT family hydrolase